MSEIRIFTMDFVQNAFSGGFHQNDVRHLVFRQETDQIPVVNSTVHAADQDASDGRNTFECLDCGVTDGGDGVVVVTHAIPDTGKMQPVGERLITSQSPVKVPVGEIQYMADSVDKSNIQMIVVA